MFRIPVLVDEMNTLFQFHRLNVQGVDWKLFMDTIVQSTGLLPDKHFFCANVDSKESQTHEKRQRFFNALRSQSVQVHEGISVKNFKGQRMEKGVDVLLALTAYQLAAQGAKDIFICSADSDLVPAVKACQSLGCRVHIVVSDYAEAKELGYAADSVISLESVISKMPKQSIRWRHHFINSIIVDNQKKYRKGVAC